jgi:hypothetical protein
MTQVPVSVTLKPSTDQSGAFIWQMGVGSETPHGPPYTDIHVTQGNSATITFSIQNGTNQNITFADNPMLVPPKTNGLDTPSVNGISMTVTDHNINKGHIPYVLAFNGAPKLDPIIDNDGGGNVALNSALIFAALGGVAIGAILVLLLKPLFSKRAPVERQRPD